MSPLFLPDAGPCFGCLFRTFRRLSPAPEIYEHLLQHAEAGRPIAPVPFPEPALRMVCGVVLGKLALTTAPMPQETLFRLHVVEADTLEVQSHRVLIDPECLECRRGRP